MKYWKKIFTANLTKNNIIFVLELIWNRVGKRVDSEEASMIKSAILKWLETALKKFTNPIYIGPFKLAKESESNVIMLGLLSEEVLDLGLLSKKVLEAPDTSYVRHYVAGIKTSLEAVLRFDDTIDNRAKLIHCAQLWFKDHHLFPKDFHLEDKDWDTLFKSKEIRVGTEGYLQMDPITQDICYYRISYKVTQKK